MLYFLVISLGVSIFCFWLIIKNEIKNQRRHMSNMNKMEKMIIDLKEVKKKSIEKVKMNEDFMLVYKMEIKQLSEEIFQMQQTFLQLLHEKKG